MKQPQIYPDKQTLARAAAEHAVSVLKQTIESNGSATWVLAGGTTPAAAYQFIADNYLDAIDWSKVTFIMGDERIGPLDEPANNWHAIESIFLKHLPQSTKLRPCADLSVEDAASDYAVRLDSLPKTSSGLPRLDLVWLGMGPDGHTLSLFPNHPDFNPDDKRLVVPVYNSPKPPANRISLTLHAISESQTTIILAAGADKAKAISQSQNQSCQLPIAQAARATNTIWMIDLDAATKINS